jgi:hypothetical protein
MDAVLEVLTEQSQINIAAQENWVVQARTRANYIIVTSTALIGFFVGSAIQSKVFELDAPLLWAVGAYIVSIMVGVVISLPIYSWAFEFDPTVVVRNAAKSTDEPLAAVQKRLVVMKREASISNGKRLAILHGLVGAGYVALLAQLLFLLWAATTMMDRLPSNP